MGDSRKTSSSLRNFLTDNRRLFEAEAQDLFRDIQSLPQKAAVRKLNERKRDSLLNAKGNANFLLASFSKVATALAGTDLWSL